MKNILTFDIEDWYHPNLAHPDALKNMVLEDRVVNSTLRIINMLEETDNKATFFIVGDVVEKFPDLVMEIQQRGHEIGSHGFRHNLVYDYTESQFETDIAASIAAFQNVTDVNLLVLILLGEFGLDIQMGYGAHFQMQKLQLGGNHHEYVDFLPSSLKKLGR